MTKVLITDYYSASNRGDAAILEGLITSISEQMNEVSFEVITEKPQAAELLHDIPVSEQQISPQQWKRWFKSGKLGRSIRETNLTSYKEADLIISTGGHHLTDTYFPAKLGMLLELYYCSTLSAPVAMVGQTLGPFEKRPYQQVTRRVLNALDLITVRDEQSMKNLRNLGVNKTPIYFTADSAFAMEPSSPRKSLLSKRRSESLPKYSCNTVTISARDINEFYSEKSEIQYMKSIAQVADGLIRKNYNVIFASTCTALNGYEKDDRLASHKILDLMNCNSAMILSGEYTPSDLIYIYKQADIHVGTRMHSCILALLAGTPVIGLEYQFKVKELFSQIQMENYLIPIENINSTRLTGKIDTALEQQTKLESKVKEAVLERKDQAMRNGKLVAKIAHKQ